MKKLPNAQRDDIRSNNLDDLLQKNVDAIKEIQNTALQNRKKSTKVADTVAGFCGSTKFVWCHILWFSAWLSLNTIILPKQNRFDPPPFSVLTLIVSLEAIFLSSFILISQNRQKILDEQRNNLDLQINLLAEQENSEMIILLREIASNLGVDHKVNHLEALTQPTDPVQLMQKLEESSKESE